MKRYTVDISSEAKEDLRRYIRFIMYRCKMPLTASRHKEELYDTIFALATYA